MLWRRAHLHHGPRHGKYRSREDLSKSARGAGVAKYLDDRGMRILAALDDVARRHSVQPAEIALAWLMERPGVTAPIASATSREQLASLVHATEVQLTNEDVAQLDTASAVYAGSKREAVSSQR